jgi:predicted nucleotidyltransferase
MQAIRCVEESAGPVGPANRSRAFPALRDPRHPVHQIAEGLEPFIRAVVERIQPEKIILFGSYAYGQPTEHSDVDLLVIRRDIVSEKRSNIEIRRAFDTVPGRLFSFTILSKTPERIAERLAAKSPFYEDIVGKGIELYAA